MDTSDAIRRFIAMRHITRFTLLTTVLFALPSIADAGPPLICHPFQTTGSALLPWGQGPDWNSPDGDYDVRRLATDTLALLSNDAPVLSRMENMRRAAIYATRDRRAAEQLLAAVIARAAAPDASRLSVFDAGYLIETYKQAAHMFGRSVTKQDGYALVVRAIAMGGSAPEMEFAAALMTQGVAANAHLERARAAAHADTVLARNLTSLGW
jgi:hypothetical protein